MIEEVQFGPKKISLPYYVRSIFYITHTRTPTHTHTHIYIYIVVNLSTTHTFEIYKHCLDVGDVLLTWGPSEGSLLDGDPCCEH